MAKKKEGFQSLTKAETEIMNLLWEKGGTNSVRDLLNLYPDPKPAYTTLATFLNILANKGFLKQEKKEGEKTLLYTPLVTREQYTSLVMSDVKDSFFGGSAKSLVSFFCKEEKLTVEDVQDLLKLLENW